MEGEYINSKSTYPIALIVAAPNVSCTRYVGKANSSEATSKINNTLHLSLSSGLASRSPSSRPSEKFNLESLRGNKDNMQMLKPIVKSLA